MVLISIDIAISQKPYPAIKVLTKGLRNMLLWVSVECKRKGRDGVVFLPGHVIKLCCETNKCVNMVFFENILHCCPSKTKSNQ